MGYAYVVAPSDRRERRHWFPLAGWVPEQLLGRAGRRVPWRELAVLAPPRGEVPLSPGLVVGLPVSAGGLARWEPESCRHYLLRVAEGLALREARWLSPGFGSGPATGWAEAALGEVVQEVWGKGGAAVVPEWAGRLAGGLALVEGVASSRELDPEQAEVVLWGAEGAAGRVVARSLARRFGRLILAGSGPSLRRLADQILHESGTAVRVRELRAGMLSRAELVVAAEPLPPGLALEAVRPETALVDLAEDRTFFHWPAATLPDVLRRVVWHSWTGEDGQVVAAGFAALVAVSSAGDPLAPDGQEVTQAVGAGGPSLLGVETVRRALDRTGFAPVVPKGSGTFGRPPSASPAP